jgi:hypothetical protein
MPLKQKWHVREGILELLLIVGLQILFDFEHLFWNSLNYNWGVWKQTIHYPPLFSFFLKNN